MRLEQTAVGSVNDHSGLSSRSATPLHEETPRSAGPLRVWRRCAEGYLFDARGRRRPSATAPLIETRGRARDHCVQRRAGERDPLLVHSPVQVILGHDPRFSSDVCVATASDRRLGCARRVSPKLLLNRLTDFSHTLHEFPGSAPPPGSSMESPPQPASKRPETNSAMIGTLIPGPYNRRDRLGGADLS